MLASAIALAFFLALVLRLLDMAGATGIIGEGGSGESLQYMCMLTNVSCRCNNNPCCSCCICWSAPVVLCRVSVLFVSIGCACNAGKMGTGTSARAAAAVDKAAEGTTAESVEKAAGWTTAEESSRRVVIQEPVEMHVCTVPARAFSNDEHRIGL